MSMQAMYTKRLGMPEGKEEIYSIMFSSLKHPARRKILRILADKPLAFSEMLELLGISSSNLTYHLENLGELVSKDESGVYRLSTFGEAAVSTMKIVEEAPEVQPKRGGGISLKWKAATAVLLIGLIVCASFAALQFNFLSQVTGERDALQAKYNQLLAWSTTTDNAITFLKDVVQLDTTKYQATLLTRTVEHRADLGGIVEELMQYSLTSGTSKLDVIFRFRNNQLSWYQLRLVEGAPIYSQAQSHIALDAAKGVLDRFKVYEQDSYLENMSRLLTLVNTDQNMEIKEGNLKLNATVSRDNAQILMMYTENGVDFSPKSLSLTFENRILKELINGWYLFNVGNTDIGISSDRAVELAKNALKDYTWSANGQTVSNFNIMPEPASVIFHPNTKNSLDLYPQWVVTFYLDKIYAGDIYRISVEVWADNGGIGRIEPQNS
jgi:DNA-binding transcriptional ArsR family regulator